MSHSHVGVSLTATKWQETQKHRTMRTFEGHSLP